MLSRWYTYVLGLMLLILGIAALAAPRILGMQTSTLVTTGVLWILTAIVALWYGFGVRNVMRLRMFSGVIGTLYLLWGIFALITSGNESSEVWFAISLVTLLMGALGLGAALTPAYWLHEGLMPMEPGTAQQPQRPSSR